MCLVMNIYVFGILLFIVMFCSMCNVSSSIGVSVLICVYIGSRLISSVGSVIKNMLSVNMCLCFSRLL